LTRLLKTHLLVTISVILCKTNDYGIRMLVFH